MTDAEEYFQNSQLAARRNNYAALDDDPDAAGEAMQLEQDTGVPSTAIYGDLDGFKRTHKAALGGDIINDNQYIAEYLNSHPMAARVSNDDLGALDDHSRALNSFYKGTRLGQWLADDSMSRSFMRDDGGMGSQPWGQTLFQTPNEIERALAHPLLVGTLLGAASLPMEALSRTTSGLLAMGEDGVATIFGKSFAKELRAVAEWRMMSGDVGVKAGGGLPTVSERNYKVLNDMHKALQITDLYKDRLDVFRGPAPSDEGPGVRAPQKEPPPYVHPLIDKAKEVQTREDMAAYDEMLATALKTATRERSSQLMAAFHEIHGDGQIGLDAPAVRRLYGDKPPGVDDGILGWLPDIDKRLSAAEGIGDDLWVPAKDWLANIDPEVAKELHDDIRARPGGFTLNDLKIGSESEVSAKPTVGEANEALQAELDSLRNANAPLMDERDAAKEAGDDIKVAELTRQMQTNDARDAELKEKLGIKSKTKFVPLKDAEFHPPPLPKEVIPEPLQAIRGSAGLEPHFQIGDRKLSLERKPAPWQKPTDVFPSDEFDIKDDTGKPIGNLKATSYSNGTKINIDWIGGFPKEGYGPNSFGPGLTRSIIQQLKNEYPNLKEIQGFRVTGARDVAGKPAKASIKVQGDGFFDATTHERFRNLLSQNWEEVGSGVSALFSKEGQGLASDTPMGRIVLAEMRRVAPGVEAKVAHDINLDKQGGSVRGVFFPNLRSMIVNLRNEDPLGTARHEIVHGLRDLFTDEEWAKLENQSKAEWMDRFNVKDRWASFEGVNLPEEGVAEAYAAWKGGAKFDKVHADLFQRIKDFFEGLRQRLGEMLGHDLSWEQIFEKIDSGEIGSREAQEGGEGQMTAQAEPPKPANDRSRDDGAWKRMDQLIQEMDKINQLKNPVEFDWQRFNKLRAEYDRLSRTSSKSRPKFQTEDSGPTTFDRGKALGVTEAHKRRMEKLAEARNADDIAKSQRRLEARGLRQSNKEYKERRTQLRDEVRERIAERPDIATDRLFATNKIKIDPTFLSDEQRSRLPKDYVQKKDGVNPDDLAPVFGYTSGDALVERLTMLTEDRQRSGMTSQAYFNRLVDVETDRRLNAEFGDRQAKVMAEAKDQALSENQLQMVSADTEAYVAKAGIDPSTRLTRDQLRADVKEKFNSRTMGEISSDKLLQRAGILGKRIEAAGSKGDWAEALRLSDLRERSLIAARYAVDTEKKLEQFERTAKPYAKRPTKDVAKRIDQDYFNLTQALISRFGMKIARTPEQLADAVRQGSYDSMKDLVEAKRAGLRELDMPDFLTDPDFKKKTIDELSAEEFDRLHRFMKQLDFNAKDERTINREGQKADIDQTIDDMIAGIPSTLEVKPVRVDRPPNAVAVRGKAFGWAHITIRSMAKRLDGGDPKGLFTRLVADRATEADARYASMRREHMKRLEALGKIPDMDKIVENDLFKDPNTGEPLLMRKRNVYGIIANWGNNSNRVKLLKGWDVDQALVEPWLKRNSTPADWDRAQKIGDIFNDVFRSASNMAKEVSGVGVDALPIQTFTDVHGVERKGWYHPVDYFDQLPGASKKLLGAGAIEQQGYFRATTPQGYTKERTGYVAPMDMNLDSIPIRLDQMLHDIAWRPAVIDMGKLIYNQKLQRAVISRYGKLQMEEFKTYLGQMANQTNIDSMGEYYRQSAFEYLRRNTVAGLVGLNPGTWMKHTPTAAINSLTQVGPTAFGREFVQMFQRNDAYGDTNLKMAHEKSEVIQDRIQNIERLIRQNDPRFTFEPNKFGALRELMMQLGSFPIAMGDFASAVPTWLAEYKKQIAAGETELFSIQAADKAVIEAHGSSMPSNLPSIMREGGPMGRMYTSLYGFFSHMLQKQYEFAWKAKDIWKGEKPEDIKGNWAAPMLGNLVSYWIMPAIIEEMVTPLSNQEHESWGLKAAKIGGLGLSSSWGYVRDFARALLGTYGDPQPGLIGTIMKSQTDIIRDFKGGSVSQAHAGKAIKDAVTSAAVLTGLTNAQEGKVGQYVYRYAKGIERPKGPWDIATGLRYGSTSGHSRSFAEWWKHMKE